MKERTRKKDWVAKPIGERAREKKLKKMATKIKLKLEQFRISTANEMHRMIRTSSEQLKITYENCTLQRVTEMNIFGIKSI